MGDRPYVTQPFGPDGQEFWDEMMEAYAFRADEKRLLRDACHEVDLIERLESRLRHTSLLVKGSRQQVKLSAIVSEIRQHRLTLASLLRQLHLDDTEKGATGDTPQTSAQEQGRAAANARWERSRGRRAG